MSFGHRQNTASLFNDASHGATAGYDLSTYEASPGETYEATDVSPTQSYRPSFAQSTGRAYPLYTSQTRLNEEPRNYTGPTNTTQYIQWVFTLLLTISPPDSKIDLKELQLYLPSIIPVSDKASRISPTGLTPELSSLALPDGSLTAPSPTSTISSLSQQSPYIGTTYNTIHGDYDYQDSTNSHVIPHGRTGRQRSPTSPYSPIPPTLSHHRERDMYPRFFRQAPPLSSPLLSACEHPNSVPCRWGNCYVLLDDLSVGGIKRHFAQYHKDEAVPEHKGHRGRCQWVDGTVCNSELDRAGLAKHVAAKHLRSLARVCPYCNTVIGRLDSLRRHMQDHSLPSLAMAAPASTARALIDKLSHPLLPPLYLRFRASCLYVLLLFVCYFHAQYDRSKLDVSEDFLAESKPGHLYPYT
ncbi:uncharacterized protein FIBRA_08215 [Fibroporia radiculosa]|uniref:C2H2-type domain-containing protein n=1 Tax=Fibroporia radiculosa TaxID=599839 RepID=J4H520_9APHY|nr:uncharacterized protein FIBRA_08215 [Fibroporia radiculosa]CCM05974.1 predicted protein [Fibroporia radiculosa]